MIVGIDEVGRGCLAGPLVAGAVLLEKPIAGLRDSKLLSRKRREELDIIIRQEALALGLGWVTARELDRLGMTKAVRLAMRRALSFITQPYERIIIDGNFNFLRTVPKTEVLIRADDLIPAVSAASIIAKVARDRYMIEAAEKHTKYGFESNVGYATLEHRMALQQHGICALHRRSFRPVHDVLATI